MTELADLASSARIFDLGQPFFPGMPHHPRNPPFLFGLTKQHGESVRPNGASSAADAFSLGGHVGTHIDALCHFSLNGRLNGGVEAAGAQSYQNGVGALSIDTVAPILRRGVLLDIAALHGGILPEDYEITPERLDQSVRDQGVEIRPGDVVLLRTGWAAFWSDPARFISDLMGPGPSLAGARWLSAHGIFAGGSDTAAFELVPHPDMPVHVHLLVERGIHIIESLNLEELARAQAREFLFIASPLKIRGGTASPIRPIAVA